MRPFILRLLNVFRSRDADAELTREVASHLARLEEEYVRRGLSAEEARLTARRAIGSVALANELLRDARSFVWLQDPSALATAARTIVREEDPTLPVDSILTMEDRVAASLAGPRSYAGFLVGFALCALAIAGVGLFGVLSYATSQRTPEIGLRSALGAWRGDVLALVGQQAVSITCLGLAVGLMAAFFLSQSLATLIYGISTRDAISFLVVPLVLIVVPIAACAAPAWRATRIDPLIALRTE
jgi:ABC-type lipoprotein release transport system permease subunit